jgi:hypothetical protein
MPKYATELTQGQVFTRSSEDMVFADTAQRVYKVILSSPAEQFDPQAFCGTYIGSRHPTNLNLACCDFEAKFDGDSRMVAYVTFKYRSNLSISQSGKHKNPKQQHPRERPATWTTSSSLIDAPAYVWRNWDNASNLGTETAAPTVGSWEIPYTPNGEHYDGVSAQQAVVDFRIKQGVDFDPMSHHAWAGYINSKTIKLGSLTCPPHTLIVKAVDVEPATEPFLGEVWNGYQVTYNVAFKANLVSIPSRTDKTVITETYLGWDRLQVLEGYKIKNTGLGTSGVDQNALNLKRVNGMILEASTGGTLALADNTLNTYCHAMVVVPAGDQSRTQVRASSPVALNTDGTPRDLTSLVSGTYQSPIVLRYQTQPEADLTAIFGLRL